MCGIFGIVSPKPIDQGMLQAPLKALRHRGPDDEGIYVNPQRTVGLAHTRLSILDLSAAGHQPMANEDETLWITYNGEIYNFHELREELISKGHTFQSRTDTEVVLHLYEEEGESAVERLVGMFAFAIYAPRRQTLFLARDRLGIKPLFYAQVQGDFLFASEIKAILASGRVPAEPDWQALNDYFTFLFVPQPQTAFREIKQLPPAHTMRLDLKNRRTTIHRYWNPWEGSRQKRLNDTPALQEQIRHLLNQAVRERLISDVPLGLFFSGGIDSTLLAAIMRRHTDKPVKTFTVIFRGTENPPANDMTYARLASKFLETEHHELLVDLDQPDLFLEMVRHVDQPFGNPTLYLQYLIAQATRQEVTVALSGVGGDELFGGYPKYWLLPYAQTLRVFPPLLGKWGYRLLNLIREDTWVPILRRAKRALRGMGLPLPEQYLRWAYALNEQEKGSLLCGFLTSNPLASSRIVEAAMALPPDGTDRYGRIFSAELETFLASNLLEYTDKATMAVALETRVPFLDHRLVELSTQIPFRDKMRWGKTKRILIDTFKDLLPAQILQAPKRGFSPPTAIWMEKILDRYFDTVMTRPRVEKEGLFSWEAIQRLRQEHKRRLRDASLDLLGVIMFDAWYRRYIQRGADRELFA